MPDMKRERVMDASQKIEDQIATRVLWVCASWLGLGVLLILVRFVLNPEWLPVVILGWLMLLGLAIFGAMVGSLACEVG